MTPPSSSYCQICQEKFQDYFDHIQTRPHRLRESNAEATKLIHDLCNNFAFPPLTETGRAKGKAIRKEKRQQQPQKKLNKPKRREMSGVERPCKGQNFSTGLVEDSSIQFKE
jgi:hypothetical protein